MRIDEMGALKIGADHLPGQTRPGRIAWTVGCRGLGIWRIDTEVSKSVVIGKLVFSFRLAITSFM